MNWKRIVLFGLLLCAASSAVCFPFGFAAGVIMSGGGQVPAWHARALDAANIAAEAFVFGLLAKRQIERTHQHAWAVLLAACLVSYSLTVLLLGVSKATWFMGRPPYDEVAALYIGLAIGSRLRSRAANIPPAT